MSVVSSLQASQSHTSSWPYPPWRRSPQPHDITAVQASCCNLFFIPLLGKVCGRETFWSSICPGIMNDMLQGKKPQTIEVMHVPPCAQNGPILRSRCSPYPRRSLWRDNPSPPPSKSQNRAMSLSSPFQSDIIPGLCGGTPKNPSQPCPLNPPSPRREQSNDQRTLHLHRNLPVDLLLHLLESLAHLEEIVDPLRRGIVQG